MAPKKTKSPWCRRVEGQEHDWELWIDTRGPACQPIRGWVVANHREYSNSSKPSVAEHYGRQITEGWECFHRERCKRCRKNGASLIYRDRCPVARGDEPPHAAPEPESPPDWVARARTPPPAHGYLQCRPEYITQWEHEPTRDAFGRSGIDLAFQALTLTDRRLVHEAVCLGHDDQEHRDAMTWLQRYLANIGIDISGPP